jgi:hypothetical protein
MLPVVVAMLSHKGVIGPSAISEDRQALESVYAQVVDVYRHYLFTDEELVSDPADRAFRLQLNLALYGELPFTRSQIDEVGLDASELPLAMELLLLVRNNDLRIADVLDSQQGDLQAVASKIETLRKRVKDTRDTAYAVLSALHKRDERLGELPPPPG